MVGSSSITQKSLKESRLLVLSITLLCPQWYWSVLMEKRQQVSFISVIVVVLGRISVVGNGRTQVPEGTRWTRTGRRCFRQGYGNARSSTDSRTAVERRVSVRIPSYFSELLDRTPNGKWTIVEDGTPFIVYKGTTFAKWPGAPSAPSPLER